MCFCIKSGTNWKIQGDQCKKVHNELYVKVTSLVAKLLFLICFNRHRLCSPSLKLALLF